MHVQVALSVRNGIRDDGREGGGEVREVKDMSTHECKHLDRLPDRADLRTVRYPLPGHHLACRRTRDEENEAVLAAIGHTRRDEGYQLAEDDVAALARAVLRADKPRGARPPRRQDHRELHREQLLPHQRGRGRVAAGFHEVCRAGGGVGRCVEVERRRVARRAVLDREHKSVEREGVRRAEKMREVNGPTNDAPTVISLGGRLAWVGLDDAARVQESVDEGERRGWRIEGTLLGR
jgi:hypothetical protein